MSEIDERDRELIEAAEEVLRKNYRPERHTVGAAVRCQSGNIYAGVNVESCGYGPCAEPIAIGAAFSNGERKIEAMVAVCRSGPDGGSEDEFAVLSPCGNCRQLLFDYAPDAKVIYTENGELKKARAADLLPGAYRHFEGDA